MLRHLRLVITILSAASLLPLLTCAQSQEASSQSVAEAAKRAREAKSKAPAKSKVISNDDVDAKKVKSAAETPAQAQPAQPVQGAPEVAAGGGEATATPAKDTSSEKKDSAEVARLKQQLASEEEALDLVKREAALAQDTYYSNPAHDRDKAGKDRLDALQQQVAEGQQKVQELRRRLAALEPAKPAASAPPSASTPPPSQL